MSERRQKLIKLLEALQEQFQEHVNKPFGNVSRGKFEFSEEELILLRDACTEEKHRLKALK